MNADEPETEAPRRARRSRLVTVFAVPAALALLFIGVVALRPSTSSQHAAAKAFDLESVDAAASRITLASFRGRPLVINFWASWCVPCRAEMPGFEKVHQELGDRVQFLGIDHQDTRPEALDLIQQTGITYPTAFDPRGGTAVDYELVGMPSTVFIDSDGRVLEQHLGALSEHDLRADIDRLFFAGTADATAISGVNGEPVLAARLVTAMAGLCTANTQAATQPDAAKATFSDESHDVLHDIAAALERIDRAASAALLVAKQKVEADMNATPPDVALSGDLNRLATITHDSLDRLRIRTDPCPSSP